MFNLRLYINLIYSLIDILYLLKEPFIHFYDFNVDITSTVTCVVNSDVTIRTSPSPIITLSTTTSSPTSPYGITKKLYHQIYAFKLILLLLSISSSTTPDGGRPPFLRYELNIFYRINFYNYDT